MNTNNIPQAIKWFIPVGYDMKQLCTDHNLQYPSDDFFNLDKEYIPDPSLSVNHILLVPSDSTEFTYQVTGLNDDQLSEVNSLHVGNNDLIEQKLKHIYKIGGDIQVYKKHQSSFITNLSYIDSALPLMISYCLLYLFNDKIHSLTTMIDLLSESNPLNITNTSIYKRKFKQLLVHLISNCQLEQNQDYDEYNDNCHITDGYLMIWQPNSTFWYYISYDMFLNDSLLDSIIFSVPQDYDQSLFSLRKENETMLFNLNFSINISQPLSGRWTLVSHTHVNQ